MSLIKKAFLFFILSLFMASIYAGATSKERLSLSKKQNKLISPGSHGKSVNVKLISRNKKKKYTKKKKVTKKKYKKKKAKKKSKVAKKSKKKKKSKKAIISSMKTCAVYNPPGKESTIVVEATSGKRKIAKKKRCKTYRKTKKSGRSILVIEIEENQI